MMRWAEIFNFFEIKEWLKSTRASQSKINILTSSKVYKREIESRQ